MEEYSLGTKPKRKMLLRLACNITERYILDVK